jgi:hypothetical protein
VPAVRRRFVCGERALKRLVAALVTVLVLATPLIIAAIRSRGTTSDTPEKCIDQLYDAMRVGDVAAYVGCFSGELREQLEATVRRQGVGSFSNYLRETAAPIKGRALLRMDYAGSDRVRVELDRVYEARMWEYQGYRLVRDSGTWKIYAIDPTELHDPPIPYGTPAYSTANDPVDPSAQ